MEYIKFIKTDKANLELVNEFCVKIKTHDEVDLDLKDMQAIHEAKKTLVHNNMYTTIFIPGKYVTITMEARKFAASDDANYNAIAKAIVATDIAIRLVGSFFITINKPPVITKIFSTEKEALVWLENMTSKFWEKKKKTT